MTDPATPADDDLADAYRENAPPAAATVAAWAGVSAEAFEHLEPHPALDD